MTYLNAYQQRVNSERLGRQADGVKRAAKDILEQMKSIERYLYWTLDPNEKDGGAYYAQNLLEHAHELVDMAHEYRAALKADPPTQDEDEAESAQLSASGPTFGLQSARPKST